MLQTLLADGYKPYSAATFALKSTTRTVSAIMLTHDELATLVYFFGHGHEELHMTDDSDDRVTLQDGTCIPLINMHYRSA